MICFSWIKFTDGSCSAMVLHEGTKEECERVADGIPGVTTSSGKTPLEAGITICTREEWIDICETGEKAEAERILKGES